MKLDPIPRLRRAWQTLRDRATASVHRFTRHTEEVLTEEPIDFSAPSIPYYENLANRLSFVRVVLYMVLFVFIIVTVIGNHSLITFENLGHLAKDIRAANLVAQGETDHLSYPISSAEADFEPFRGGLVIAGSEVVTALSASGKQTLTVNVAYADPEVRASEKYFITFGRGERSFSVYNAFVQVHRESTEFPVYDATVGDNGTFAILTRSRDYSSEVILYDDGMERIAAYHLNGYVTGLAMNPSGDCLGVVSMESTGGIWTTKITLIRIEKRITSEVITLEGRVGSTCDFVTDDRLAILLDDRLLLLKPDATVTREIPFEGRVPRLVTVGDGRIALLTRDPSDLSTERLAVYDRTGSLDYETAFDAASPVTAAGGAELLTFSGSTLYLRTPDRLFALTGKGKELTVTAIGRNTVTVLPVADDRDGVLVCTPAYATRLDRDDLTTPSAPETLPPPTLPPEAPATTPAPEA